MYLYQSWFIFIQILNRLKNNKTENHLLCSLLVGSRILSVKELPCVDSLYMVRRSVIALKLAAEYLPRNVATLRILKQTLDSSYQDHQPLASPLPLVNHQVEPKASTRHLVPLATTVTRTEQEEGSSPKLLQSPLTDQAHPPWITLFIHVPTPPGPRNPKHRSSRPAYPVTWKTGNTPIFSTIKSSDTCYCHKPKLSSPTTLTTKVLPIYSNTIPTTKALNWNKAYPRCWTVGQLSVHPNIPEGSCWFLVIKKLTHPHH